MKVIKSITLDDEVGPRRRVAEACAQKRVASREDVSRLCQGFLVNGSRLDGALLVALLRESTNAKTDDGGTSFARLALCLLHELRDAGLYLADPRMGEATAPATRQRAEFLAARVEMAIDDEVSRGAALVALQTLVRADRIMRGGNATQWRDWCLTVVGRGLASGAFVGLSREVTGLAIAAAREADRGPELAAVILRERQDGRGSDPRAAAWLRYLWQCSRRAWSTPALVKEDAPRESLRDHPGLPAVGERP